MSFRFRHLQDSDLPAVMQLQLQAYPELCESREAIASRIAVAPQWCWAAENAAGIGAYLLTHLWTHDEPPAWNHPLPVDSGAHAEASHLYIHDLALSPLSRGSGLGPKLVQHVLAAARETGIGEARLIAVQDSTGFWARQGFQEKQVTAAMQHTLPSYGRDARLMYRPL